MQYSNENKSILLYLRSLGTSDRRHQYWRAGGGTEIDSSPPSDVFAFCRPPNEQQLCLRSGPTVTSKAMDATFGTIAPHAGSIPSCRCGSNFEA
jgi:hypothetical protein